jgi:hypothetical protein
MQIAGLPVDTPHTPFMRDLETRFARISGLENRSAYKIFYGQVRPAPILTLGINPGGAPENTNPDGRTHKDGVIAAASASFYENDEHDVLDCEWRENRSLRRLLLPLVGNDPARIRSDVVKTNLAFHRSVSRRDIDLEAAIDQSAPFLGEIIETVSPSLVLLTGVAVQSFTRRFAVDSKFVVPQERDPGVKQVVFAAALATTKAGGNEVLVVQLAHPSMFGWTYTRYKVAQRICRLLKRDRRFKSFA